MRVRPYRDVNAPQWDAWCAGAINATFLHTRRFLSYHGERFEDLSLVIEDEGGTWLGVLPAALAPDDASLVVSHPGLTYGGVVHAGRLRGEAMVEALGAIVTHYRDRGLKKLHYKAVPAAYHAAPAQDDLYALFRLGARRCRCDLSSCIDLEHPLPRSSRRRRSAARARAAGVTLDGGRPALRALWDVLKANLAERHGVAPVHTLAEIEELASRFPDWIAVRVARHADQVVAGTVLFCTPRVVHAQYLASSPEGRRLGALDLVLDDAIEAARRDGRRYFDFGISTEDGGRRLNQGLHGFKSEFGAGGLVHEFYEIDLRVGA